MRDVTVTAALPQIPNALPNHVRHSLPVARHNGKDFNLILAKTYAYSFGYSGPYTRLERRLSGACSSKLAPERHPLSPAGSPPVLQGINIFDAAICCPF